MKHILLVNPWIHDFAAYDFWIKPIGLLSIGAVLRQLGYEVHLIDCLDRYNPDLLKWQGLSKPKSKNDCTGKFHRQPINKPTILRHVPRRFCRYGLPPKLFENTLRQHQKPLAILVTKLLQEIESTYKA